MISRNQGLGGGGGIRGIRLNPLSKPNSPPDGEKTLDSAAPRSVCFTFFPRKAELLCFPCETSAFSPSSTVGIDSESDVENDAKKRGRTANF